MPTPSAPLIFPPARPQPAQPPVEAIGPLAELIIAESNTTQRLGEQAKALQDDLAAAHTTTETARVAWQQAAEALAATQSFGHQVGAPSDPNAPSPESSPAADPSATTRADLVTTEKAPGDLVTAETATRAVLDDATAVEQEVATRYSVVLEQFQRHVAALQTLTTRNNDQLAAAERARDAYEESLAASRGLGASVNGLQAAAAAQGAVEFALKQLGKPYVWATQGPNTYDCSGLVLASTSPSASGCRGWNNQYGAGRPVLASQLLPGDLLFFSPDPRDWRQIHHVAIYIGHGQMVHAPTFGDVVKVSPIWWSEYFGATRMVPAMPMPGASPSPTPEPTSSVEPSPSPTASPDASLPSGSPSPSPSLTPTPSPSPQPAPASASAIPTPSPSAPADPSPVPSPSPSPSPTQAPDQTPAVVPSPSVTGQPRRRSRH
jgi:cell wall-associated NlpC family hydrolase